MVYLQHIETLVPENRYQVEQAMDLMKRLVGSGRGSRYIDGIYKESGISTRYSVISQFESNGVPGFFGIGKDGRITEPATGRRNEIFRREAQKLVVEVARRAVEKAPGISREDITHVITVSCTGFYNPGPDLDIVNGLGLAASTQRYHLGFMGCYAAFPAMRMAAQFCEADPAAAVLVVCLELCTLHVHLGDDLDTILSNSLFADGAAAVIISSKLPQQGEVSCRLGPFQSMLLPEGENDMAWQVGDRGFDMVLSKYVPRIIGANIKGLVDDILQRNSLTLAEIDKWAVHPGGKSILDKIEESLLLAPEQLRASRQVLSCYGNMSSVTILFVLREIIASHQKGRQQNTCALAFGPGLTIESLLLYLN